MYSCFVLFLSFCKGNNKKKGKKGDSSTTALRWKHMTEKVGKKVSLGRPDNKVVSKCCRQNETRCTASHRLIEPINLKRFRSPSDASCRSHLQNRAIFLSRMMVISLRFPFPRRSDRRERPFLSQNIASKLLRKRPFDKPLNKNEIKPGKK